MPYWGQGPEFKHSGNCWETKQLSNSLECFNSLAGLREKQKNLFCPNEIPEKNTLVLSVEAIGKNWKAPRSSTSSFTYLPQ